MQQRKVGLALGSGAARGWAHIGVLNKLLQMGIKIDVIAGCSAGALVGAAYASHRLSELESWARSFTYWKVAKLADLSWHQGGLMHGDRIFDRVADILKVMNIQDCHIPFACVTTNLSNGRELWLTQGNLRQALRASCSIPGLFKPVQFEDYWLVDGAVVNPLPISLARALGADIVIAVDLQHDANLQQQALITPPEMPANRKSWKESIRNKFSFHSHPDVYKPSALQVISTSIEVLENRLKNTRLANDPADILIQPYCPQISLLDFHRANEAITAGEIAVEKQESTLVNMAKQRLLI